MKTLLFLFVLIYPAITKADISLPKQCTNFYEEYKEVKSDNKCPKCYNNIDGYICKKISKNSKIKCGSCLRNCKRCCVKKCRPHCLNCRKKDRCRSCDYCKEECDWCCRSTCSNCKKKKSRY